MLPSAIVSVSANVRVTRRYLIKDGSNSTIDKTLTVKVSRITQMHTDRVLLMRCNYIYIPEEKWTRATYIARMKSISHGSACVSA